MFYTNTCSPVKQFRILCRKALRAGIGSSRMALAISPGRDPDETPDDRVLANLATVGLGIVLLLFVAWLVWEYVI
jgi:hypothetical protein